MLNVINWLLDHNFRDDWRVWRDQPPSPSAAVAWKYLVIAKISLKSPFSWLLADNGSSLGLKRYYSSSRGRGLITPLPSKSWSAAQLLIIRNRNGVMKQLQQRRKKEIRKEKHSIHHRLLKQCRNRLQLKWALLKTVLFKTSYYKYKWVLFEVKYFSSFLPSMSTTVWEEH